MTPRWPTVIVTALCAALGCLPTPAAGASPNGGATSARSSHTGAFAVSPIETIIGSEIGNLVPDGPHAVYLAPPERCPYADGILATTEQMQDAMRCLINFARREKGLAPLRFYRVLGTSAALKRADLVRCQEFSHTACGRAFTYSFRRSGYARRGYRWSVGENLAWGTGPIGAPRSIMYAWLNSPAHRANIFNPRWRDQGVDVLATPFLHSPRAEVWVSHFGSRVRTARP